MIDDTYEESGMMRNKDQENKKKQKLESILIHTLAGDIERREVISLGLILYTFSR